jgi:hypothetical protein
MAMIKAKKILAQIFTKHNIRSFFSAILFIGCAAFVAFRGYSCFDKYLKNPEVTDISYKSINSLSFPSFTLCTKISYGYNLERLKECLIEMESYFDDAQWVGKEGNNCTDPKILWMNLVTNYEDLEFEEVWIRTFVADHSFSKEEFQLWEWKLSRNVQQVGSRCFSFSIPEHIVLEGIVLVKIQPSKRSLKMLFLHKYDMISAPVPGATAAAKFKDIKIASVTYESVNLLNYDGKPCNDDNRYNYDDCKQEYIYKVINVGEPKNAFFFSKVPTYTQCTDL